MAYAALVFLEQELEKLLPKHDEYIHLYEKEQIGSLLSSVTFLQKFLEDFPGNSSLIKQLESQAIDVAYEVSDIIAWGISDAKHEKNFKACIREVCSIVEDAKEIRKVLEMKANIVGHDSWITSSSSTVAVPTGNDTRVGLDTHLTQMKERIFGHESALKIIPITGMGGIGKTTLVKSLYEDRAIVAHFDVRSWVSVSQEHNAGNILKEILGDTKDAEEDIGSLIVDVHKKLSGRRFLIVVDDIWSVEAWDSIRNAFQDGNKGSRIVITTRLTEVATKVGSSSPLHEMQLMNEVQSWELFQKEAFGQHEHCPAQLEYTGKTITNNCKGLPLAIVVTAKLLKSNRTQKYWEKFDRKMNDAMAETHDDQLMRILSLSYDNLPSHLKACFLYMSMFPEDADIRTRTLKWLWVAEGFLKPEKDKSVEEVAEKCLLDLIDRNLLSIRKRTSSGRINLCTVHDLLRDLSVRKAQEEKFSLQIITLDVGNFISFYPESFQERVQRRCTPDSSRFFGVTKTTYGCIYSLICDHKIKHRDMRPTMMSKLARVVDALETPFKHPVSFGVNLRYLALNCLGGYDELNDTLAKVRKLKNLETLIINHYRFHEILLFPIQELPKLKHFVSSNSFHGYCLIDNHNRNNSASKMSLLQTLSGVLDIEWTTNAIDIFANLVKLRIGYIADIIDHAGLNNLAHLEQLEYLSLYRGSGSKSLPRNIAFPDNIKKINLQSFAISWEIMSVMGSLPNLQVLKLFQCFFESDEWEPVEGEFQQLKYLKFGVEDLVEWKVESTHFPCLEQLVIRKCSNLWEVPAEVGEIESLQILTVAYHPTQITNQKLSALKIQEEQQKYGNYQLQVVIMDTNYAL